MNQKLIALAFLSIVSSNAVAQDCKFEVETDAHVESKYLTIFRGGSIGLAGHFGIKEGLAYLRARYFSQFRAKAQFDSSTPLLIELADGTRYELPVLENSAARLKFAGFAMNNREAQPTYEISHSQMESFAKSPITAITLNFVADSERRSTDRSVKESHAEKMLEAIRCLPLDRLVTDD